MNEPRRIHVNIERLVLRGFDAGEGRALAAALEAELRGRLADSAFAADLGQSRSLASLNLGKVESAATAKQIGRGVARRFARSIKP